MTHIETSTSTEQPGSTRRAGRARSGTIAGEQQEPGAFTSSGARAERNGALDRWERSALGLGWFSLGLGVAQILIPGGMARLVTGASNARRKRTMRMIGVREVAAGLGLLGRPGKAGWLWARVAGDVLDLALLGSSFRARRVKAGNLGTALAAVAGVTVLDYLTGRQLARHEQAGRAPVSLTRSITVARTPEEAYSFWRNLENLPSFMPHLHSVKELDERRSHWVARGPGDATIEWDAELLEDRRPEKIAWRSTMGARIQAFGSVEFTRAPGNRGAEVKLEMTYAVPGGVVGQSIAKLFGKGIEQVMAGDLRRFKQVLEIGEVVESDASVLRTPHPARPLTDEELASDAHDDGGVR